MEIFAAPDLFKKRENWFISTYYRIRSFFRFTFNRDHVSLLKEAWLSRPWDHSYLYQLEYEKIKEMLHYQEKTNGFVDVEYVIRDMKICLSLLEIMMGKRDLFHFDGTFVFVDSEKKDENGEPLKVLKPTPDFKYHCDVNVNLRNMKRFIEQEKLYDFYTYRPDELYVQKAKKLYHKIRYERDEMWWE